MKFLKSKRYLRGSAFLFSAALTAFTAAPAMAKETSYLCELTSYSKYGWIPSKLFLVLDEEKEIAWAYDYFISLKHENPISVDLSKRGDQKRVLTWKVKGIRYSDSSGSATARFRASLNKKDMKINFRTQLEAADGDPMHGRGTCKIVE